MKALSVRQPWTSLIAEGTKTVEVRSWRTRHRGPLVICAAAQYAAGFAGLRTESRTFPLGVAVCIVDLVDVVPMRLSLLPAADPIDAVRDFTHDLTDGLFAWLLESPRVIVPQFPVRGQQGLFSLDMPTGIQLEAPGKYYEYLK